MSIKPDTAASNKNKMMMTEELRYKLQKMIWDKFGDYIFPKIKSQGGYDR